MQSYVYVHIDSLHLSIQMLGTNVIFNMNWILPDNVKWMYTISTKSE